MRYPPDLLSMACPPKYRALGQFHNYYAQRKVAPVLTIVIGGNHESSGYMWELYEFLLSLSTPHLAFLDRIASTEYVNILMWLLTNAQVSWWMVSTQYLLSRIRWISLGRWMVARCWCEWDLEIRRLEERYVAPLTVALGETDGGCIRRSL